jgi:hypothetical protein
VIFLQRGAGAMACHGNMIRGHLVVDVKTAPAIGPIHSGALDAHDFDRISLEQPGTTAAGTKATFDGKTGLLTATCWMWI